MVEDRRAGTTTAGGALAVVVSALWALLGLVGVFIGLALALIDENDGEVVGVNAVR